MNQPYQGGVTNTTDNTITSHLLEQWCGKIFSRQGPRGLFKVLLKSEFSTQKSTIRRVTTREFDTVVELEYRNLYRIDSVEGQSILPAGGSNNTDPIVKQLYRKETISTCAVFWPTYL
jgi:hypothetical protein